MSPEEMTLQAKFLPLRRYIETSIFCAGWNTIEAMQKAAKKYGWTYQDVVAAYNADSTND